MGSKLDSLSSQSKTSGAVNSPKRGRKLTDPDKYCFQSKKKIDDLQAKLDNGKNLTAKQKQKLRNQISAQKSRSNKKAQSQEYQLRIEFFET